MAWITKWLTVPASNETTQVKAVQLWDVRWTAHERDYPYTERVEHLEGFPTESEAEAFAVALRQAFRLTRTTAHARVTVTRAR